MPALVAGIHVFGASFEKDVDGRDKPGHDEEWCLENTTALARGADEGRVEHHLAPRFAT